MGLRDEVQNEQGVNSGVMKDILSKLNPEEAEELLELLADTKNVQGSSIYRVLKKRGFEVSERTVQRYRRELT